MDICNYKVRNLTKFSFFLVGLIINGSHQNFLNIVIETAIVFFGTCLEPLRKIFTESKAVCFFLVDKCRNEKQDKSTRLNEVKEQLASMNVYA